MKRSLVVVCRRWSLVLLVGVAVLPQALHACACGCGIFDVGTRSMLPTQAGGMIYTEYDYQHQNQNWAGDSPSSAENNDDKKVLSNFFQIGGEYMFNRRWGVMGDLPYTSRYFKTGDDGETPRSFTHNAVGDIRLKGIYAGLSDDMSTGLTVGLKLPTGDFTYPNFDPDVEIGSGSTDLLLGTYHLGKISGPWNWFANVDGDIPVLHASGYRPGTELDAASGVYVDGLSIGTIRVVPLAQIVGAERWSDDGTLADAQNTGYSRLLASPGLEVDVAPFRFYADVGFPVYQHTTGNQLVASEYYKVNVAYHF